MSGAASEFAQMGEHPLTGGLQDAVGTEHAGIALVWNCATWSARRDHVRRSIRKCEDSRASERGPCESACGRDMSLMCNDSRQTARYRLRVIGMWGGNSCGGGVGLSMPSVAVEHPNKILIRGFSHTTRRTSSRGRRGRKPEPHTQGPARASFLEQSPSKVRTAAPTHFLLPQPSSSSLPFPGAERVSDRRNRSAENSPAPALPPPLTSSPPLLSPSVCCAGTRWQMHHCAVGTRRITACDGRTDGTVLERRSSSCYKRFGRRCHV